MIDQRIVYGPLLQGGEWATRQPDMSDCKSAAMTNLEVKVRQEDPENVLASSLAHLTGNEYTTTTVVVLFRFGRMPDIRLFNVTY